MHNLKNKFNKLPKDKCIIPVLKSPSESLNLSTLKYGLHQIFVDKSKHIKRIATAKMES